MTSIVYDELVRDASSSYRLCSVNTASLINRSDATNETAEEVTAWTAIRASWMIELRNQSLRESQ